ncbi:hypothetical protein [Lyticum sinuosum]|uniref:Uncharacterized protein n=1 Tax=Lyticum sinuosum TaxID=1332059 RepID=A0AAE5AHW4_9RICK|nr:hypothetical protein [Lyticum sinuosum]MDZ5761476.1 hypothetical protein [Lyticum sinuosum]
MQENITQNNQKISKEERKQDFLKLYQIYFKYSHPDTQSNCSSNNSELKSIYYSCSFNPLINSSFSRIIIAICGSIEDNKKITIVNDDNYILKEREERSNALKEVEEKINLIKKTKNTDKKTILFKDMKEKLNILEKIGEKEDILKEINKRSDIIQNIGAKDLNINEDIMKCKAVPRITTSAKGTIQQQISDIDVFLNTLKKSGIQLDNSIKYDISNLENTKADLIKMKHNLIKDYVQDTLSAIVVTLFIEFPLKLISVFIIKPIINISSHVYKSIANIFNSQSNNNSIQK